VEGYHGEEGRRKERGVRGGGEEAGTVQVEEVRRCGGVARVKEDARSTAQGGAWRLRRDARRLARRRRSCRGGPRPLDPHGTNAVKEEATAGRKAAGDELRQEGGPLWRSWEEDSGTSL
jgi:hypothetical protein